MEKRGKLVLCLSCIAAFTLATATTSMANLLANPGLETDAVAGNAPTNATTGWSQGGPANDVLTSSNPPDPVHGGIGSLQLSAGGGFSVPVAFQRFAASPGQTWDFQGFGLITNALPAGATFGLLKLVWQNSATQDLQVGTVLIGTGVGPANPGIESVHMDSTSPLNTWIFMETSGIAPSNTAFADLLAINVDQNAAKMWFDDMNATVVPEPSSIVLALSGLLSLAAFGWKKRRV